MSTFGVEVVPVVLEKHPDADSLSIVRVYGYQVIVRSADWEGVTQAAYIPPDSVVPDTEEYAFLDGKLRIKARRFRGEWSQGMLMPAPKGSKIGDEVSGVMGIKHYEPPVGMSAFGKMRFSGPTVRPPWARPDYDMESWYRWNRVIQDGEEVVITEKVHGCNARYTYSAGQIWVGSHHTWKECSGDSAWHRVLRDNEWIKTLIKNVMCAEEIMGGDSANVTVYGEVYGDVQDLKYGCKNDEYRFAVFDILINGKWMDHDYVVREVAEAGGSHVPVLYVGPFSEEVLKAHADGKSVIAPDQIREGVVIKPTKERDDRAIGRVLLKAVSNAYLERSKGQAKRAAVVQEDEQVAARG